MVTSSTKIYPTIGKGIKNIDEFQTKINYVDPSKSPDRNKSTVNFPVLKTRPVLYSNQL